MPNDYFRFKQFTVQQDKCAMKVTTDGCLFGAWVAADIQNSKLEIQNVLDVGTGTGLLALMIAQKNAMHIDAVEIDTGAAEQASENVSASKWKDRIRVINKDVRELEDLRKYQCIVANPPFYENEIVSSDPGKNIAHHSEHLRLDELFASMGRHLEAEGKFYLLLPSKREAEAERLLRKQGLFPAEKVYVKQTPGHLPFRIMVSGSRKEDPVSVSEMIIADEGREYSADFTRLLQEYYLHL